jgi:hypothetical protein
MMKHYENWEEGETKAWKSKRVAGMFKHIVFCFNFLFGIRIKFKYLYPTKNVKM